VGGGGVAARAERGEQRLLGRCGAPLAGRERRLHRGFEEGCQARAAAPELEAAQRAREVRVLPLEQAACVGRHGVDADAELLLRRREQALRGLAVAIGLGSDLAQLRLGVAAEGRHDHLLLVVQTKVHGPSVAAKLSRV
jgi:hypothetical protein